MKNTIFFLGWMFFMTAGAAWPEERSSDVPPEVEEALRARVTEYFTLFQHGEFRQAEAYVTEESKNAFYVMNKASHEGFSIRSMDFDEDAKSARAVITLQRRMPILGDTLLPVAVSMLWKVVDGEWYAHFPLPKPGDVIDTPFGKRTVPGRTIPKGSIAGAPGKTAPLPDVKSAAKTFLVDRDAVEFPANASGPVSETVSIENLSQGALTMRRLSKEVKGLDVELRPEPIPPGEKAALTFTYRPAVKQWRRPFRMRFVMEPLARRFTVKVTFTASQDDSP